VGLDEGGVGEAIGGIAFLFSDPLLFFKKKIATATTIMIKTIQIIKLMFLKNKLLFLYRRPLYIIILFLWIKKSFDYYSIFGYYK